MGRRGRKPEQPISQGDVVAPQKPNWMEGEAARKWEETTDRLRTLGTLGKADATALTRYCQQWSQWIMCQSVLAAKGLTMEFEMEGQGTITKPRPEVKIANDLAVQMKRFEDAMGMNAGSRHGMGVQAEKKPIANPFAGVAEALKAKRGG